MTWNEYIEQESKKDYFVKMYNFLKQREQDGAVIYPDGNDILRAFRETPIDTTKVVILGQD